MSEFLFQYEKVNPISWAYLSSLLMIGLFFKFNRFWSVRNLDLILLILLTPGLLVVQAGLRELRQIKLDRTAVLKTESQTNQDAQATTANLESKLEKEGIEKRPGDLGKSSLASVTASRTSLDRSSATPESPENDSATLVT